MKKNGEITTGGWIAIIIGIVAILAFYSGNLQIGASQPVELDETSASGSTPYISTGGTTLIIDGTDKYASGTSITPTVTASTNSGSGFGAYLSITSGTTTRSPNDILNLYVTNSSYKAKCVEGITVPQSPSVNIPVEMLKNATSITLKVYDTDNNPIVAGGTANNQSGVVSGGTYNLGFKIEGQDKAGTGNMECVFEGTDNTKSQDIIVTGMGASKKGNAAPSWYTLQGTTSMVRVYSIPSIEGAIVASGNIQVISKTGQSLAGTQLYINCYAKKAHIDPNSGMCVDNVVEDSNGNAQTEATYSFAGAYFTA